MLSRNFQPFLQAENFKGVDSLNSHENMDPGSWTEDSINIFSDPQGAVGSRPGFTGITSATVGAAIAWCGFYQFDVHSGGSTTSHYIGGVEGGKLYTFASNKYEELYTGLSNSNADDARFSFFTLDNTAIICNGLNTALKYTGSGSAATFATSITADFGIECWRYGWLHSTVDPRLLYYCTTLGDPDSAYTSFLNFDEDEYALTGVCKQGNDMLVGKRFSLFRVQYRGTEPLFKKYRLSAKVGPVCHWVMKQIPDGRVIFLAPDFNFYMVEGNDVRPCGDNIRNYVKAGVNSRIQYAVSGLNFNRSQYWCSFTYTSGVTTNDRTVVMDWSRPYLDKWGHVQYPWFIYSIGANCFAEVTVSGKAWLYHGGYVGKMYKDDTGTNDDGSAFSSTYKSPRLSHGDQSLEKKYSKFSLSSKREGDWDLTIQFVCDGNAATEKNLAINMLLGLGYQSLFDVAKFDEDYFSSETDIQTSRDVDRQGKLIQISMGTTGKDESWLAYSWSLLARALRRGTVRTTG